MEHARTLMAAVLALILGALLTTACDTGPQEEESCRPGLIIPGLCVDGIKLGDSRERVEAILGPPGNVGWADGFYRTWRTYSYPSPEPHLFISFIYYGEDRPWGPVDMIFTDKAYQGRTPEGIGNGSSIAEVLKVFGNPSDISEWYDGHGIRHGSYTWCYGTNRFGIGITQDTVRLFFWGYHIPFSQEEDMGYRCGV